MRHPLRWVRCQRGCTPHTHAHTHKHTHAHTHAHTRTHTLSCTHSLTLSDARTLSHETHSLTLIHTLSHSWTNAHFMKHPSTRRLPCVVGLPNSVHTANHSTTHSAPSQPCAPPPCLVWVAERDWPVSHRSGCCSAGRAHTCAGPSQYRDRDCGYSVGHPDL